jgi:hypothetical protein
MVTLQITGLPDAPLDAAMVFHGDWLAQIRDVLKLSGDESLALVLPPADHSHRGWRLAAVQELARENAPRRVNALVSSDEAAIAAALDYLTGAAGVTGQLLALDGTGVV